MTEQEVAARLAAEGLTASPWSSGPGDQYAAHEHGFDKVLVCARGSITFGLPDRGERVALEAGDRLELPAGTRHDAVVGEHGVVCYEAHLPAGALGGLARRAAGTWEREDADRPEAGPAETGRPVGT